MKKQMDESRRKFIINLGMAGLGLPFLSAINDNTHEILKLKTMQIKTSSA